MSRSVAREAAFCFASPLGTHLGVWHGLAEIAKAGVILIPGSGAIDVNGTSGGVRIWSSLAVELWKRGIMTLRFSKRPASLKSTALDSPSLYLSLLNALLETPEARVFCRSRPLCLLGHSLGGHLLPFLVNHLQLRFDAAVIVNANFLGLGELMSWQMRRELGIQADSELTGVERMASKFIWPDHDVQKELRSVTCPLLYMACGRDDHLPPSERDCWLAALQQVPVRSSLFFPNLDHFCAERTDSSRVPPQVSDGIAEFLNLCMLERPYGSQY